MSPVTVRGRGASEFPALELRRAMPEGAEIANAQPSLTAQLFRTLAPYVS